MSGLISLLLGNTYIQGSVTCQPFWLTLLVPSRLLDRVAVAGLLYVQGYRNGPSDPFSGDVVQVFAYCTPV